MKRLKKVPIWVELGLVALLVYMLSDWILPVGDLAQPSKQLDKKISSSEAQPNLSELVAVPLFGRLPLQLQKTIPVKQQPITLSPLTIRLLGAVVAGKASSVIVSLTERGEQQVFTMGDFIQPGVKLHFVDTNAMIVERSGKLQRIVMEYSGRLNIAEAGMVKPATDLSMLMTQAKLALHHDGDQVDGFLISGIVVNSIYHKTGLYNGDLIREINGIQLVSAEQIDILYSGMQNPSKIALGLIRAGKVKRLNYEAL